jgi:hypothetical protein
MKTNFERSKLETECMKKVLDVWKYVNDHFDDLAIPIIENLGAKTDYWENIRVQTMSDIDCDEAFACRLIDTYIMIVASVYMDIGTDNFIKAIEDKMQEGIGDN